MAGCERSIRKLEMMTVAVHMVDVFGARPFTGNPLAVVSAAEALSTVEMQRIARWFNLSETAFLLPPSTDEADYQIRIFTLDREMSFAGHPTLGACHVWLTTGGEPRNRAEIIQECGAGLVSLRRDENAHLSFAAPPLVRSGAPTQTELREAQEFLSIGAESVIDAAWIDNGPGWLGIELASAEKVLSLNPQRTWPRRLDIGIVGPHPAGNDTAFELRAFFSDHLGNIVEDPVTGSLNASVGQWLFAKGTAKGSYTAAQGTRLGREGRIHVDSDGNDQVWVGGLTRTNVAGQLWLEHQPS